MKTTLLTIFIYLWSINLYAQVEKPTVTFDKLAIETGQMNNGYSKALSGNDFTYHSLIGVNTNCLIARANDKMEWVAKSDQKNGDFYEFIWLAGLDVNHKAPSFTLSINDAPLFTFKQANGESWSITNKDGSQISFYVKKLDMHEDAHGYMYLKVPVQMITSDETKFTVEGDHSGSHSWFMTFKETDINKNIYDKAKNEMSGRWELSTVDNQKVEASLSLSKSYTSTQAQLVIDNQKFSIRSDKTPFLGKVSLPYSLQKLSGKSYQLFSTDGHLIAEGKIENNAFLTVRPEDNTFVSYKNTLNKDTYHSEFIIKHEPKMVQNVVLLSKENMVDGKVALMNSSHQDIAWMDTPEKCIVERDTMLITPILRDAKVTDDYSFDIEDALMIKEYIERHPESKEEFVQLLNEEKISVGASFTQPYEEMYSGESLSRQFYHGKKWLAEILDGYDADTYWNMDVPGRTLQMPQIMAKSGVNKLVISRQAKGIFNWEAPNGDQIITFSLDHYSLDFLGLNQTLEIGVNHIAEKSLEWTKEYNTKDKSKAIIPILSDWDMSPAKDYSDLIALWNSIKYIESSNGDVAECVLPKIDLMTTDRFIDLIYQNSENLNTIKGERPNLWVYIHGPSHQKALLLSRKADRKLVSAEKLSSFQQLIAPNASLYPQEELYEAWEKKIYPDHGWGGKNGDITDAEFKEKYNDALHVANAINDKQAEAIAGNIKFKKSGIPLVVFNHLNWANEDIIEKELQFNDGEIKHIGLIDDQGKEVVSQVTSSETYKSGYVKSATLYFKGNVPALGYSTYYVVEGKNTLMANTTKENVKEVETKFFKIKLGNGGIESLIDKGANKELIDTSNFLGGEVFYMTSRGNGAGEFVKVQHPTFEDFEQLKDQNIEWSINNKGPLFTDYSYRSPLGDAVVEGTIRIYTSLEKIDFLVDIKNWEGTMYREYRMAFPVNKEMKTVEYQVPYGVVEVGTDEVEGAAGGSAQGSYTTPNKDIHPRGIENWISAKSENTSLVVTSSVAAADYYDVKDKSKIMLQPILFASRHSCHWEGNPYPQTGNHQFEFTLSKGNANRIIDNQKGIQNAEQMEVVFRPQRLYKPSLKTTATFVTSDNENIVITAIKKAEDSDDLVIRFYNVNSTEEKVNFSFNQTIKEAALTSIIEEEISSLPVQGNTVSVTTEGYGITTIKVSVIK
ncbi:glycoside hydrolase family 38 N-terminal domain-containing protein [Flammeovirga pacifica]|uniref:Alpha-mannosidase n=1 Tax=Flammeovirga pacifica TaxID=915059 RepID=A0A1S1Z068_FLAPC|nr:glycosyl hydrolase-related protein [Flammeovirga pacifica]OHX66650.1 hypothetical protein NH26_09900 [Flammeovirga pacifica]